MDSLSSIQPRICFITLGCAKNEVDTSHMQEKVLKAGYVVCDDPESADAVIINTCSFIQSATEESLDAIFQAADLPLVVKGKAALIVAGCMPARYGDELEEELVEVNAFIPCNREDDIVKILEKKLEPLSLQERSACFDENHGAEGFWQTPSAYVKISDGCDRFCTYCSIPYIRGAYQSYTAESIIDEIDGLVVGGIKEIVLVAQDSGRWGTDLNGHMHLSDLLKLLAERHSDTWFRIMYIQPEGITDDLLSVVDSYDNICSYFDIPLQHVDEGILAEMKRTGSSTEYLSMLDRMRNKVRNVNLRTTLIAGFPGESEQAFHALCDFVEEAEFDYVGVFPYSAEEGTEAATYEGQIPEDEKLERAQKIRDIADAISFSRVEKRVGNRYSVLLLGQEEDGQLYGRTQYQAPDVDGVVYVNEGEVGKVDTFQITDALLYEMEGVRCG